MDLQLNETQAALYDTCRQFADKELTPNARRWDEEHHFPKEAVEKLDWYALRWKIEVFHKILKSGCKAEESMLRSADRLPNLISVLCIVSWRIFWLTMVSRASPQMPGEVALTLREMQRLDELVKDTPKTSRAAPLARYTVKIAQLGGYLARASDPPPGHTVIWRGLRRLIDIQLGFDLAKNCG